MWAFIIVFYEQSSQCLSIRTTSTTRTVSGTTSEAIWARTAEAVPAPHLHQVAQLPTQRLPRAQRQAFPPEVRDHVRAFLLGLRGYVSLSLVQYRSSRLYLVLQAVFTGGQQASYSEFLHATAVISEN